jgi:hypothetical protein
MPGDEVAVKFKDEKNGVKTYYGKVLEKEGRAQVLKHFQYVHFKKDDSIEVLRLKSDRWSVPPSKTTRTATSPDKYWCFWSQYKSYLEHQSSGSRKRSKQRKPSKPRK